MNIRNNIKSSLTVGLLTFSLIFGLSIVAFGANDTQNVGATVTKIRSITAPTESVSLSAERGDSNTYINTTDLTYETDFASGASKDQIIVSASLTDGNAVDGAILKIKGGDIGTFTYLWDNNVTGGAATQSLALLGNITNATDSGTVSGIRYKLDATNVPAGTADLDSPMTFQVTFTIEGTQ